MKFSEIASKYQPEMDDVSEWCSKEYDTKFSQYFVEMESLYERIQAKFNPITDSELELILTDIPLQLFAASEALSAYKASLEIIKLQIKQNKHIAELESEEITQTAKKAEAAYSVLEDETFIKVYSIVIERVERQITFAKELIMSAKKIWSARRETESIGVSTEVQELPDYSSLKPYEGKTYIG